MASHDLARGTTTHHLPDQEPWLTRSWFLKMRGWAGGMRQQLAYSHECGEFGRVGRLQPHTAGHGGDWPTPGNYGHAGYTSPTNRGSRRLRTRSQLEHGGPP